MMSIPFQPHDLPHTDRSIAVLLAQTMSGQVGVLHATNIRTIARGSMQELLKPMENWTQKEQTLAEVKVFINVMTEVLREALTA